MSSLSGFKLLVDKDDEDENLEKKWFVKLFLRYMPYVDDFGSGRFFISIQNRIGRLNSLVTWMIIHQDIRKSMRRACSWCSLSWRWWTPCLPWIVFLPSSRWRRLRSWSTRRTFLLSWVHNSFPSSAFLIVGLRALYFAISGMVNQFHYLKYGLAVILIFVGVKMILGSYVHVCFLSHFPCLLARSHFG